MSGPLRLQFTSSGVGLRTWISAVSRLLSWGCWFSENPFWGRGGKHNPKVEIVFHLVNLLRTQGWVSDSLSGSSDRLLQRDKREASYIHRAAAKPSSQNIKRSLLIKENLTSQGNYFRVFLCIGKMQESGLMEVTLLLGLTQGQWLCSSILNPFSVHRQGSYSGWWLGIQTFTDMAGNIFHPRLFTQYKDSLPVPEARSLA